MRSVKRIINEKKDTVEIKGLVEVYEEIAAGKMQDAKNEILIARDFFDRLTKLSSEIGNDLGKGHLGSGGDVAIFVSAQTGLFGDIIDKIFVNFLTYLRSNPNVDIMVVGKLGKNMMSAVAPDIKYTYIDFEDENIEGETLSNLVKSLVKYRRIYVFYGKFRNIASQETSTSVITGRVANQYYEGEDTLGKYLYIYEPKVETIADVFSQEIASLLFNSAVDESRLAKYASRLMYLDAALERIDEKIKNISFEKNKAVKRNLEKKQMTSYSGIRFVG